MPSGSEPDAPRVAIAWNGQVYPVLTVGEKASLADDVKQLLDQDKPGSVVCLPAGETWAGRAGKTGSGERPIR